MSKPSAHAVYRAVEVLFYARHSLPSDVLRSLDCIVLCASAAQFGEPYERSTRDLADYVEHDVVRCEAESSRPKLPSRARHARDAAPMMRSSGTATTPRPNRGTAALARCDYSTGGQS